jgi:hypothetical protein
MTSPVTSPVTGPVTEGLDALDQPETPDRPAQADQPVVVIPGAASAEEVAALVAVLHAVATAAAPREPDPRARPQWSAPQRAIRRPHAPRRGAWRSVRPAY